MKINNEQIEKTVARAEDECEKWRIVDKIGTTSDIDDRADCIWLGHPSYKSKEEAEDAIADLIERGKIDEGGEGYTVALMKPLFVAVECGEECVNDVVFSDASLESVVDAAIHAVDGGNYRDNIDIGIYPDAVEPDGSCELHAYARAYSCAVEYKNDGFAGQLVEAEDWIALDSVASAEPRTYKDFLKISIGESDIASLTIRSCLNISLLRFGEDGDYYAYECFGDDIEIGAHYKKVFTGYHWLTIYDDNGVGYNRYAPEGYKAVDIYRAGEFGCIIHWRSEKKTEVNATITDEEAADLLRHSANVQQLLKSRRSIIQKFVEREKEADAGIFGKIERWYYAVNEHCYATVGNFPFEAVYDLTDHAYADIAISPRSLIYLGRGLLRDDFTVSESEIPATEAARND